MKKYIVLAAMSYLFSVLVLVTAAMFATAAKAFDDIESGNIFYISIYHVPVWAICIFFFLAGSVFSILAFMKRKSSR